MARATGNRMRGGGNHSDEEEGPDADLTVGILAKHKRRLEAEGVESGRSFTVVDGTALEVDDSEGKVSKKRKKRGALDRLEERERSRSRTPGSERQDSDLDSPGRKKKKKRRAFHEADLEGEGFVPAERSRLRENSSEEEGQILEQSEEELHVDEELTLVGNDVVSDSRGLEQETPVEKRKASKAKAAGPTLEAPDSSPPRDVDTVLTSGDTLAMHNILRGRRYWDPPEENEQRCFNCGATGHKAWNCPEPKKERPCFVCGKFGHPGQKCPTGKLCFVCGKGGHEARDCPKKGMRRGAGWASGEGQEGNVCYKCGWEGHTRAECWRDYDESDLKLIRCYICGKHGHLSCVDVVENGPKTVTCYQCGQAGHTGDGCARGGRGGYERDDGGPVCFRCGEKGHIARGCSKQSQNNFSRDRRPAYYHGDSYRGGYNDRYEEEYADLDESEYDYMHNSRSQDGNEGLWLGGGYKAKSSRRDDLRSEDDYQGGVSRGTSKYGSSRRYSDGYGYESRREEKNSRYEYYGYNEDGRAKSTGRQRWGDDQHEEESYGRRGRGSQEYQETKNNHRSYSVGKKRHR